MTPLTDRLAHPLTFAGRRSARNANYGVLAFFATMLVVGLALPFLGGGQRGFVTIALLSTATWGTMAGLVVQSLRTTFETITLDQEGIVVRGRGRERRVPWERVTDLQETDSRSLTIRLSVLGDRPLVIRAYLIEDGPELARIVREQVDARPRPGPADGEVVYRAQNLQLLAIMAAIMLATVVVIFLSNLGKPKPPGALVHPAVMVAVAGGVYLLCIVNFVTQYVRLLPGELIVGALFERRSLPLVPGQPVEVIDEQARLRIRSGGKEVFVSKRIANLPDLRARLAVASEAAPAFLPPSAAPLSSTVSVTTAPSSSPVPGGLVLPQKFKPRPASWSSPLTAGIFILGLSGAGMTMAVEGAHRSLSAGLALMAMCLIFMALGIGSVATAGVYSTRYEVSEDGIEAIRLGKMKRYPWDEVERAWRVEQDLNGYRLEGRQGTMVVQTTPLNDGGVLREILNWKLEAARERALEAAVGRSFRSSPSFVLMAAFLGIFGLGMMGAGFLFLFGSASSGQTDLASRIAMMGICLASGALMAVLGIGVLVRRYRPTPLGLEVRSLKGSRTVSYAGIRRVELGSRYLPKSGSTVRTVTLEHPDGEVTIDANIADFDLLRETILHHVDPGLVRRSADPSAQPET